MPCLDRGNEHVFWRDGPFWLALGLGPLCWLLLDSIGVPTGSPVDSPVDSPFDWPAWQTLLLTALVYPVLEEYVFRGGLQAALYQRSLMARSVAGVSLANVLTSVAFAAAHLFHQPPLWAASIFFPSLVFGWMRDRYQTIHASILLHMAYNAGFVVLFSR